MYESTFDQIRFIEGIPERYESFGEISTELGGVIAQSQLKNIKDLKAAMAKEVRRRGGNAVIDFRYGQRSVGFWRSLFQLDDINWYGTGVVARL